jgi:hypothetical protein
LEQVDQLGGVAADQHRGSGRRGHRPHVGDELAGLRRDRVGVVADRDQAGVRRGPGDLGGGDAGHRPQPFHVAAQVAGVRAVHDHRHRGGGATYEVPVQGLADLAALGIGGQRAGVDAAEHDVAERQAEGDQRDHDHHQVGQRPPHHAVRDPGPGTAGAVRCPIRPAAPPRDRQRVDARAEHPKQGRQHRQRGHHRHQHRGDAAKAHGAQEHLREQKQPGQRDRHGQAGEGDRAAGGGHGAD